jgi:replication factor C small subunit
MSFFENIDDKSTHTIWCERYRPTVLEDYVGNDTLKAKVSGYIQNKDIPHLLFYGKAGTGKTTLAHLITKRIECDVMVINASDENGVETLRVKIKNFASSVGFKPLKVIILDESDYLTVAGQAILRNMMETFSKHCRFILTCNYLEKIIQPIQSRCQSFQIIPPTKKDVAVQIATILKKEGIQFTPAEIVPIVDGYYPDIRKIINTCQLASSDGVLTANSADLADTDVQLKLIEILKEKDDARNKLLKIRQFIADSRITDFTDFYSILYEKVDEYGKGNISNIILAIADGAAKDALVIDKEITFCATLITVIGALPK